MAPPARAFVVLGTAAGMITVLDRLVPFVSVGSHSCTGGIATEDIPSALPGVMDWFASQSALGLIVGLLAMVAGLLVSALGRRTRRSVDAAAARFYLHALDWAAPETAYRSTPSGR